MHLVILRRAFFARRRTCALCRQHRYCPRVHGSLASLRMTTILGPRLWC